MATTKIRSSAQLLIDNDLDAQTHKIINVTDGTAATDVATFGQLQSYVNGTDWKNSVRAATTANITLSGAQTIDGVSVIAGDRVLVKAQTLGQNNGLYLAAAGTWTRTTDADANPEVTAGMAVMVEEGTVNVSSQWRLTTNNPITLGTTVLVFAQIGAGTSYTAADASITISGSTIKVAPGSSAQIQQTVGGVVTPVTVSGDATIASGGAVTLAMSTVLGGHLKTRETPSGSINGSNTSFTLASTPIAGTEMLYLNGLLQEAGAGNDYTISGGTITYLTAPVSGDRIRITYWY